MSPSFQGPRAFLGGRCFLWGPYLGLPICATTTKTCRIPVDQLTRSNRRTLIGDAGWCCERTFWRQYGYLGRRRVPSPWYIRPLSCRTWSLAARWESRSQTAKWSSSARETFLVSSGQSKEGELVTKGFLNVIPLVRVEMNVLKFVPVSRFSIVSWDGDFARDPGSTASGDQ